MDASYKILLIEPDCELANRICLWLKDKAHVVHISDEDNARKLAASGEWDLVITDIQSSEINNLDIIQIVKKINPLTAILIIAENIKVDFILTAMKYHADGLFFKPLDENEFTIRVLQLAAEAQRTRKKENKIILAIGAHPDDVEIGCGGTLAKLRAEGHSINILTLSLGAIGGVPETRKLEAEKAAKLLGAKLFLGAFTDTKISNSVETIVCIESIIDKIKPTHVFTHSFNDGHQDHRNVYQATVTACRSILNVYSYLSPSSTIDFKPNRFITIDEYMDEKLKIIAAYTSQRDIRPYLQSDMIRTIARYWGRFSNYSLVEPMEVIKEQA